MRESFFFEKLTIYQRSLAFSVKVCALASGFPMKFSRISDQLMGAAISVPLNIAEGSGRKSPKERINFYNISRSSMFECVPILEICKKMGLIDEPNGDGLLNEAVEISKMINGFISTIR